MVAPFLDKHTMEKLLQQFVDRLQVAAGENLRSVLLYGSAAAGDFHENFSDVNLFCVFRDLSAKAISALSDPVEWWRKQKHPAPLLMSMEEVKRSLDVFPIEFLDIEQRHRVLYGEDVFIGLEIPRILHRVQVEHELRTKLIRLRQEFLINSAKRAKVLSLMLESFSSFVTLFRHSLLIMGEEPKLGRRALLLQLQQRLDLDTKAFLELLSIREAKLKPDAIDVNTIFASYLKTIEQVIWAVDQL